MVNNNNTRVSKLEGAMNFCVSDALAFEDHVRYVDQLNLKNQERLDKIEDYLATRKEEPDHYEIYGKLEGCLELYEKAKSEQKLVNNTLIEVIRIKDLLETRITNVTKEWQQIKNCNVSVVFGRVHLNILCG